MLLGKGSLDGEGHSFILIPAGTNVSLLARTARIQRPAITSSCERSDSTERKGRGLLCNRIIPNAGVFLQWSRSASRVFSLPKQNMSHQISGVNPTLQDQALHGWRFNVHNTDKSKVYKFATTSLAGVKYEKVSDYSKVTREYNQHIVSPRTVPSPAM
jgi:hypothetical protein